MKSDSTPLLSVIVPIYNVEKYIEHCARCLFEQTYSNIEYIFIDDCTPDSSISVLTRIMDEYPNRHSFVKIIHHSHNLGLSKTRMEGFHIAEGDYLTSCDSDDYVDRDAYELMMKRCLLDDSQIAIADMLQEYGDTYRVLCGYNNASDDHLSDLLNGKMISIIPSSIFKSSLLKENPIIVPTADMAEDMVFSVQLLYFARSISYISRPFYHYRNNPRSISKSPSRDSILARFKGQYANTNLIISFLNDKHILTNYQDEIFMMKHIVKISLLPIVDNRMAYQLWKSTYPEIVWRVVFSRKFSVLTRFYYFIAQIGIYPFIKKCIMSWH